MPALDVNAWRRWASKASGHEIADAVDALGQLRSDLVRDAQRAGKAVPATGAAASKNRAGGGTSGSTASGVSRPARKRPRDTSATTGSGSRAGKRPPEGRDALGRQRAAEKDSEAHGHGEPTSDKQRPRPTRDPLGRKRP